MSDAMPDNPLHRLLKRVRKPVALREIMASCLRSIHMGDPYSCEDEVLPQMPQELKQNVSATEQILAGVRCAIYRPSSSATRLPIIIYMHGGGFVVGSSEDTDYATRRLCHSNQSVVISINYRLAPKNVFPSALTDCQNVLREVIKEQDELNIDPSAIYLCGDSAGGNLALSLFYSLKDERDNVKGVVLLAPWLDMNVERYESYNRLAPTGIVFDAPFIAYARACYVNYEDWCNPLVSPIHHAINDLPPCMVLVGTEDPLLDQSLLLHEKALAARKQDFEIKLYADAPHCFYQFPGLCPEERDCFEQISDFIRRNKSNLQ